MISQRRAPLIGRESKLAEPGTTAQLFIARGTVKMHLARAYRKLDASSRIELAAARPSRKAAPESERAI
jgi:hypothetical protein